MAVDQTITHAAAAPAATIPVIDIPEDARTGGCGELLFRIRTTAGAIDAAAYSSHIFYRGTADALEAAGIVRKEWLPGAPGCNRTAQTVVFGANGPSLHFGRGRRVTEPHIKISTHGKKFLVLVSPTEQQKARLARARSERARETDRKPEPVRPLLREIIDLCMKLDDTGLGKIKFACEFAMQDHSLVPAEPCPVISLAAYRRSKAGEATAKQ